MDNTLKGVLDKIANDMTGMVSGIGNAVQNSLTSQGETYSPDQVWGPPSPGQSWQDYADEVYANDNKQSNLQSQANAAMQRYFELHDVPTRGSSPKIQAEQTKREQPVSVADAFKKQIEEYTDEDKRSAINPALGIYTPSQLQDAQQTYKQFFGDMIAEPYSDTYRPDGIISENDLYTNELMDSKTVDDILRDYGLNDKTLGPVYVPNTVTNLDSLYESDIDDGNLRESNLKSQWMTGARLKEYVKAGIPDDRTPEELGSIPDNAIINKLREYEDHGFVPYSNNLIDDALLSSQGFLNDYGEMISDNVGNWRTNTFKYGNEINGKKFIGNEFDDAAGDYFESIQQQMNNPDVYRSFDPNEDHEGMTPYKNVYTATLSDGTTISDNDYFTIDEEGNIVDFVYEGDPIIVYFPNVKQSVRFDDKEDYLNNMKQEYVLATNDEDIPAMWVDYDNMVLPDGTELTFDEARQISEGGGNRDYGLFNIAKPSYLSDGLLTEDGSFNFWDIVPTTIDLFAQSSPYFFPQTSIPLAASNFAKSIQGIDPMTMKSDGSYNMLSSNMSKDRMLTASLGNAAMPLTEIGLGRIGGKLFQKPLNSLMGKITEKFGERAWMPTTDWMIGTVGEGLEEIPGNITEELSSTGLRDWYANPMYMTDDEGNILLDETGNPLVMYDDSGHEVKDLENTTLGDRFSNLIEEAPEAFWGGTLLGGIVGAKDVKPTVKDTMNIYKTNKADKDSGLGVYRPVRAQDIYKPITEEELLRRQS